MASFGILRTNPKLTTNIKVVFSRDDKIYLESFDNGLLSDDIYKRVLVSPSDLYEDLIPYFYSGYSRKYESKTLVSNKVAYGVNYQDDNDKMYDDYNRQHDDSYLAGCSKVEDNKFDEEFECFAPLHIDPNNMPKNFIIFRVDGTGILNLTKNNFKTQIIDNLKCVVNFDLTKNTKQGQWISSSFSDNDTFPQQPLDLNFNSIGESTKWYGIDYESGGFTNKSFFLQDIMKRERSFYELDELMTKVYEEIGIVYPNIINFKFLFDDTPATKTTLRKWTINRYYGFYFKNLDLVKCVTPYSPPKIKSGVKVGENNIFVDSNGNFIDPFERGYKPDRTHYVEFFGNFYQIRKISDNKFKIISSYKLKDKEQYLNKNVVNINENTNVLSFNNGYNNDTFEIDNFDKADVWLIKIDELFHVLRKVNGRYIIQSDYGFRINNNKLEYWINESDDNFTKTINLESLINENTKPQLFYIYRANFLDIKDFDNDILETDWAGYEYELQDEISQTDEPKMYTVDLGANENPNPFNQYIYDEELINIPASSEYVANGEVFELRNPQNASKIDLTPLWRQNPTFCKWGYMNSISNNDSIYRLNNSFYGEDFNRTTNVLLNQPYRPERTLDYFYTVNPDSNNYINHSLHVSKVIDSDNNNYNLDVDFKFEIDKYFNYGTTSDACCCGDLNVGTYCNDYFTYFFGKKEYLSNGDIVRNTKKWSVINNGDNAVSNSTLFRGIKFNFNEVSKLDSSISDTGKVTINSVSYLPTNYFDEWKFSIILDDYEYDIDNNDFRSNPSSVKFKNEMDWQVIFDWEPDEEYSEGDLVSYFDIIYQATTASVFEDPTENPSNSPEWTDGITYSTVLWNPNTSYSSGDVVYNYGEWYIYNGSGTVDFWNPGATYSSADKIIFKGNYYSSISNNNGDIPDNSSSWISTNSVGTLWDKLQVWSSSNSYSIGDKIYYNNTVYESTTNSNINKRPDLNSSDWSRYYSLTQDTDYIYGTSIVENNLIFFNENYYLCKANPNGDTLDNGINIYINKKWKNILIQIYINDNTFIDRSGNSLFRNINRDDIYNQVSSKLVARNFIDALNNLENMYDFADYVSYYVIEEDLSFNKYSISEGNISHLPYLITCEEPSEYNVIARSLLKSGVNVDPNSLPANFKLDQSEINNINQIDYYNSNPVGVNFNQRDISDENNEPLVTMYRFEGPYMPVFKDIHLFERSERCNQINGNYKFDTELTYFGLTKDVISKVNLQEIIFKLKDSDVLRPIYPQLDEFGYIETYRFIFKSTWDNKYYVKTTRPVGNVSGNTTLSI